MVDNLYLPGNERELQIIEDHEDIGAASTSALDDAIEYIVDTLNDVPATDDVGLCFYMVLIVIEFLRSDKLLCSCALQ